MKLNSRGCSTMLALCMAIAAGAWADGASANAWQEAKSAIRSFPANVKQGGKEYGLAMRDSGRALGHASRDGYYQVRDGFRRDFIQGGAWRGRPAPNPALTQRADPQ